VPGTQYIILNEIVIKLPVRAGHQWLTPIILATQEAEISRIEAGSQPREIVQDPISKYPTQKKGCQSDSSGRVLA
jgi:hypothetical protein